MRTTAFTLAQELTRAATNPEFGDLRDDMVQEIIHRRVHIDTDASGDVVEGALRMLCITVAVLADEIAASSPSAPVVIVEAGGITVRHGEPLTAEQARHVGLRLLEASTAAPRQLRRPSTVDDAFRDREGGR